MNQETNDLEYYFLFHWHRAPVKDMTEKMKLLHQAQIEEYVESLQ